MRDYKTIRCGRGLGDALYLQGVVQHLVKKGEKLHVMTDWPDVFKPLEGKVTLRPFTRERIDIIAHYTIRKHYKDTSQFKDCCIQAGISEHVDFVLDWKIQNKALVSSVKKKAKGKPILLVEMIRNPMNRTDRFGIELLPDLEVMQEILNKLKEHYFLLHVGQGKKLFEFEGIDLDLADATSVTDLIDLAYASSAMFGYCSFFVPLAESLNKKSLFVWSRRGMNSVEPFIRTITPQKILHKRDTSHYVVDNWPQDKIDEVLNDFLR